MNKYQPPFTITKEMLFYIHQIEQKMKDIDSYSLYTKNLILRKENQILSIQSSLAIEENKISLKEATEIIQDKRTEGLSKEMLEIKNAYQAYQMIHKINPYSLKDLMKVQQVMMNGLISDAGKFRYQGEGVFAGDDCIFMAPPAEMVHYLMKQLFSFLKENKDSIHPLILSSVFHYEFIFIHPFADGNGRMARLWQTILLTYWNPMWEFIPIETEIKQYQQEYYQAIHESNQQGNSNAFILFILKMILASFELLKSDKL